MKLYDAMFAVAIAVALIGGVIGLWRGFHVEPLPAVRVVQAPPPPPLPPPPRPDLGPPPAPEEPAPAEDDAPQEAEDDDAPDDDASDAPASRTPQDILLGTWDVQVGGMTGTMTFHRNGQIDASYDQMPPDLLIDASYTWEGDDRLIFTTSMTGPDGQTRDMPDRTVRVVSLTETELVLADTEGGPTLTLTR